MHARLNAKQVAPEAMQAMRNLDTYVRNCSLEHALIELVRIRASQINGCAFCLNMHTKSARAQGEREDRLHVLAAWRESPFFTDRERAALTWTEALTLIAETRAPDADWALVREQFSDVEIVDLSVTIGLINAWNRLAIGFRYVHPVADKTA